MRASAGLGAALALGLCAGMAASTPTRSAPNDRPELADDIERRLDGAFLFTTDGSSVYRVLERVENDTGLPSGTEIICLMRQCYVEIATVGAEDLAERSRRPAGPEAVRRRFRAARDAYDRLLRADTASRATALGAWGAGIAALRSCLKDDTAC